MRMRFTLLLIMVSLAPNTFAQAGSVLNFPRLLSAAERETTGFALVNPTNQTCNIQFRLYDASGRLIVVASDIVRGGQQLARLGSEIFRFISATGWVQASCAVSGVQGFWLGGDFSTYADGAAAATPASDQVFPFVTSRTEISIVNPGMSSALTLIAIRGIDGQFLGSPLLRTIPAQGVLQEPVGVLFPGIDFATAKPNIRIIAVSPVSATAMVRDFLGSRDSAVINGIDASEGTVAPYEVNLPHVVSGPIGNARYRSVIGVANQSVNTNTYTVAFFDRSGSSFRQTFTLPGLASTWVLADELFAFGSDWHDGWVKITGTDAIGGFVAYADSVSGGVAVVPGQNASTRLLFAHIADLEPWGTGLALLNPSSTDAVVEVFAIRPGGGLIGGAENVPSARITLPARSKTAKLLSEFIPRTQCETSNGGFVLVRSANNVPIHGIQLFFLRSLVVLSNIAAGALSPTISYTPPQPSSIAPVPSINSFTPTKGAAGTLVTITGTNFSSTPQENVVRFGSATAAVVNSTCTSVTVQVPQGTATAPITVTTEGRTATSTTNFLVVAQTIITDVIGDSKGRADLSSVTVSIDPEPFNESVTLAVRFAPGTYNRATTLVQFALDTDRNPFTGYRGLGSSPGGPDANLIGSEIVVTMGSLPLNEALISIPLVANVGRAPITFSNDGMEVTFGRLFLLNYDGRGFNFKVVAYDTETAVDYAPDLGVPAGQVR